ncbi:Protein EFR3 [Nakaseomyces bracarensis]|uniref:Protein EFR3 n=1 Tax=Nakaseomyces bracarensis TaxID=273131 RepID=A0ABR4NZF3_9SACH
MQLVRIFTPKHQKLVNQCYPSGRAPDKKPKSSETSYLLYYVGSRSSKLEKVSNYLIKRTNADLNRRRVGNVCVTLELMAQIIEHCKENLNVFVKEFMTILQMVLSNNNVNNDVSVIEILEGTFHAICVNMDSAYYSGDPEFIKMYKSFVDLFFDVIAKRLNNDDLHLKLCGDISETMGLASDPQLNYLVLRCVGFALDQCRLRNPRFNVNSLDQADDMNLSKRLSRTQTRADENADLPTAENDLSVAILHKYFNTTETDKLNLAIRVLIKKLQEIPNKELLEFICNDVPVQLRYIVILLLTRQVTDFAKSYEESNTDFNSVFISLQLISALLVSDISIVGLSVLDIMRKVLAVQLRAKENRYIVQQCRTTIKDLDTKIYYSEQTSDMLYELVVKLKTTEDVKERDIIVNDIKILVDNIRQPVISVDLLTELVPFMKGAVIQLLNNTEDLISGGSTLSRLFQMVRDLDAKDLQSKVMAILFEKYRGTIMLSGLNYFQTNIKEPEYTYYLYHFNAAKVLNSNNYYKETQDKLNNNELFTKDDLLKYYQSTANSKVGDKGVQILMSYENQLSNTDLLNDHSRPLSPTILQSNSNNIARANGIHENSNGFGPFGPFTSSRIASDDARSWKAMRPVIPKVSDLKKVMNNGNGKSKLENSFKGSQSVKSRVTNITFLLSELKSSAAGDESGIIDPDEEEIEGLDKMEIARSFSTRSKQRPSVELPSTHRSSFVPATLDEDDEFRDANEDIENHSTRGKLFSSV